VFASPGSAGFISALPDLWKVFLIKKDDKKNRRNRRNRRLK